MEYKNYLSSFFAFFTGAFFGFGAGFALAGAFLGASGLAGTTADLILRSFFQICDFPI